ncbi:hypothetical protein L3Q72_10085 [Vibrio sp. JC009]|uniref:hypothetical protein n=1 Tax=Vibrio sp. JC009 TaxID=2912314 RepID=UPI0023AFB195|nr:hypothetical protein [Vibrio sp. JC009]WED20987.1 hypothetical protein L3Q72_10085 [Vibrio sp. JC009]
MKSVIKKCVYAVVATLLVAGCTEEEQPPFQKKFVDKGLEFSLDFNTDVVDIVTPSGSITKPFAIEDNHLKLHYADPLGKENDILLTFYQDDTGMELSCKECAKYQLPSRWYLDMLGSKN